MEKTKISTIGLVRLNNAANIRFHSRVSDLIEKYGAEKLGISIVYNGYKSNCLLATDLIKRALGSAQTATISNIDNTRDDEVIYVLDTIKRARKSPFADTRNAAEALLPETKIYKGIARKPYEEETQLIDSLIFDLTKYNNKMYVETLGLTKAVAALAETNAQFKAAYNSRSSERAEAELLAKVKALRTDLADQYEAITSIIYAQSLTNPEGISTGFINELNIYIAETKNALSHGKKKSTDESTETTTDNEAEK